VREMADVFKKHNINTAIIAASIRHPRHIHEAAMAGAHIATVPFSVLKQMVSHPLTDLGVERFLRDWAQNRTDEMF
jgi:transaldolase